MADYNKPLIECGIHEHSEIKKFLLSNSFTKIDKYSNDENICYKTKDSKYVYVRYAAINNFNRSFVDSRYRNEDLIYYDLVIYESLQVMNLLRIFDLDPDDIDEDNFRNHKKKVLISNNLSVPVTVINKNYLSVDSSSNGPQKRFDKNFGDNLKNGFELENGKFLLEQSINTILCFRNKSDYGKYQDYLDRNTINLSDITEVMSSASKEIDKGKMPKDLSALIGPLKQSKSCMQTLKELDKKINLYFFDDYFIHRYFSQIVTEVGNIVIARTENSKWELSDTLQRYVLGTPKGKIDFIPMLFQEMRRQKHTGFCSTEAIIGGLMIALDIIVENNDLGLN